MSYSWPVVIAAKTGAEKDMLSNSQNKAVSVRNGHSGSHTLMRDVMCIYFVSHQFPILFKFCAQNCAWERP
jgi:hypothetical protein